MIAILLPWLLASISDTLLEEADAALARNDTVAAVAALEAAWLESDSRAAAATWLIDIHLRRNRPDQAQAMIRRTEPFARYEIEFQRAALRADLAVDDLESARFRLNLLLSIHPQRRGFWLSLVRIIAENGHPELAYELSTRLMAQLPLDSEVRSTHLNATLSARRLAEAETLARDILSRSTEDSSKASMWYSLGVIALEQSRYQDCLDAIEQAVDLLDAFEQPAAYIETLAHLGLGDFSRAWSAAIRFADYPQSAEDMLTLAPYLSDIWGPALILGIIDEAQVEGADEADVRIQQIYMMLGANRVTLAGALSDQHRVRDGKSSGSWINRGWAHHLAGEYAEALEAYDHALQLGDADATLLGNRALTLAYLSRVDEAIDSAEAALALSPDRVRWSYAAAVYFAAGDRETAHRYFRRALEQADSTFVPERAFRHDPLLHSLMMDVRRVSATHEPPVGVGS